MRQDWCAWRTAAASQPKDPSGRSIRDVGGTGNGQIGPTQGIVWRCGSVGSAYPVRGRTSPSSARQCPLQTASSMARSGRRTAPPRAPMPQRLVPTFFPCRRPPRALRGDPGSPSFLAKQQSRACAVLRCAAVAILTPSRERDGDPEAMWRRSPSASRSPSRPQWCGLRRQDGDGTWPPSAPSRRPAPTSSPATS